MQRRGGWHRYSTRPRHGSTPRPRRRQPGTTSKRFFVREILQAPAAQHRATAEELRRRAARRPLTPHELERAHRRLACLFAVDVTSFERKRLRNLSHEPNKAMNLNSYISLLGKRYRTVTGSDGVVLEADDEHGSMLVPAADYLITLDAAVSCCRVTPYVCSTSWNSRATSGSRSRRLPTALSPRRPGTSSVRQPRRPTSCTSFHQGSSRYRAAYWVGANALLRTAALEDIAEHAEEHGYPVTRYIQDRTVIEDTESSIDLVSVAAGAWRTTPPAWRTAPHRPTTAPC